MTRFTEELEARCRRIVRQQNWELSHGAPTTSLRREMALLLSEMDSLRERHERQRKQLLRRELDLGTQILNLEDRIDLIPNWLERRRAVNEAKHTLDQLMFQRERVSWETESSLQRIRVRLLELWNLHDQLAEEHGDR